MIERRPCLSQQPQDFVCPGLVCCTLRLFGLAQGLVLGITYPSVFSCHCRCRLRLEFPLTLCCCSGDSVSPLSVGLRLQRLAVMHDSLVRTPQVLRHFALKVRPRL